MNIYHRLLNILAETTQPEYWTIDELVHYLDLSQRKFAQDSKILVRTKNLLPVFDGFDSASNLPVTVSTIPNRGLFKIPDDSLEILDVLWRGKLLDKQNPSHNYSKYSGTSHFSGIRGEGHIYERPVEWVHGCPKAWFYDNGIRIIPYPCEKTDFWFLTFSELDLSDTEETGEIETTDLSDTFGDLVIKTIEKVDDSTEVYIQFSRLVKVIGEEKFYEEGDWEKLEHGKDYFIATSVPGDTNVILTDELIHRISCRYKGCQVLPNMLFSNPSRNAVAKYIPVPSLSWNIKTIADKGIRIEMQEKYHEGIACHAAFLALSKEGSKTQDIEKAQIYLERYRNYVEAAKKETKGSVNVDLDVMLPFRM